MKEYKIKTIIKKDGEIKVTGIPFSKGQKVELILLIDSSDKSNKKQSKFNFNAVQLKTKGYKFDRELANER